MPNVVLFMLDQLAARWLEAAPAAVPTPHIEALRARGTTFTRCFSSNPLCCPARATLATGLSSRGHGVLQNGYALDPAIPTFMQNLQAGGWATGAFGKLHFRPHFAGLHPDYRPYGFDVVHNTEDGRGGEWLDWILAAHPQHLDAVLATFWATHIPELADYGPQHLDLAARIRAIRKNFTWARPEDPSGSGQAHALPFPEALSQTCWITGHAVDWLRQRDGRRPFFAQVSYVQPHGPFGTPGRMLEVVDREALPAPAGVEWDADPDGPRCFRNRGRNQTAIRETWRETRSYYFADIAHLDEQLGAVTDALRHSGVLDDTVILLTADHGEMLEDHGLWAKGEFHYDACVRVPLIIAGPGVQGGQTRSELVQLEDLAPTILDLAGRAPVLPHHEGPYLRELPQPGPGRSLLPLCRGEVAPAAWRTVAYMESYNNLADLSTQSWARTVHDGRWRYTWYPDGAGEQLFDTVADPQEQHNRVRDPASVAVRERLREALLQAVVTQDHPHPPRSLYALGVH